MEEHKEQDSHAEKLHALIATFHQPDPLGKLRERVEINKAIMNEQGAMVKDSLAQFACNRQARLATFIAIKKQAEIYARDYVRAIFQAQRILEASGTDQKVFTSGYVPRLTVEAPNGITIQLLRHFQWGKLIAEIHADADTSPENEDWDDHLNRAYEQLSDGLNGVRDYYDQCESVIDALKKSLTAEPKPA